MWSSIAVNPKPKETVEFHTRKRWRESLGLYPPTLKEDRGCVIARAGRSQPHRPGYPDRLRREMSLEVPGVRISPRNRPRHQKPGGWEIAIPPGSDRIGAS